MNYVTQLNAFFRVAGSLELSSSARMLYLSLLNKNNSLAWIRSFTCTASELESLSGLSTSGLQRARKQLVDKKVITYSKRGSNKAPRYSIPELLDNFLKVILNDTPNDSPNNTPVNTPNSTPNDSPNTLTKTKQTKTKQSNKDSHDSKPAKRVYEPDDLNLKLANYLLTKIRERNSSIYPTDSKNPPDTQKWANDIRLMHERDARSYDDIKRIIEWCQQDSFWQNNILSASKLRKQFGKLIDKADAPNNFNGNKGGRKPIYDLPY